MSPLGGRGFPHPSKPIISPFGAGHHLDKLSMLEPFSEYWVYFSLLPFLCNPFCNSILLIKYQTFCLLWRKCPVTYKQKTWTSFETEWQTAILYRKQTQSSHCLQKVPVSSNYASLHLQIFNKHLFFFLLLMFLQLFNLHLCWQASTIKCKIWLLALGRLCVAQ